MPFGAVTSAKERKRNFDMGEIAAAGLAAVGAFLTSAACYCLKKQTEWEHVNFRCNVTDGNCNCGFVHDNTEVQQKIAEVEMKLRVAAREERERFQKEAEAELVHVQTMFQKDLELADKQNQLEIAELERDLGERKSQVLQLTKTVEEMKNDYIKFREQVNTQLFQKLMSVESSASHTTASVGRGTPGPPRRQLMRNPSVPPTFNPPVNVLPSR